MLRAMRVALSIVLLAACGSSSPKPAPPATVTGAAPSPVSPPAPPPGPPVARTVDVIDHQFGVDVPDPYRWMEGPDNPELKTWLAAQGAWAHDQLAKLPGRDALLARVREIGLGASTVGGLQI